MDTPPKRKRPPPKGSFVMIKTGLRIGGKKREPKYRILKVPKMRRVLVPASKIEETEIPLEEDITLFDTAEQEYVPDVEETETDLETEEFEEAPEIRSFREYKSNIEKEFEAKESKIQEEKLEALAKLRLEELEEFATKESGRKGKGKEGKERKKVLEALQELRKSNLEEFEAERRSIEILKQVRKLNKDSETEKKRRKILQDFGKREKELLKEKRAKLREFKEADQGPSMPIETLSGKKPPEILEKFRKWEFKHLLKEERKKEKIIPVEKVERVIEYEEIDQPLPRTRRQKELIKRARIRIPEKARKIVPKVKVRTVREYEITHDVTRRAQVGPFGIYIPFKVGRPTKPIGDQLPKHPYRVLTPRILPRSRQDKPVIPLHFTSKREKASDYYNAPVTQEVRDAVIEMIFEIVSERRIPIAKATLGTKEVALGRPLLPGLIRGGKPEKPPPKISKKNYQEAELQSLVKSEIYSKLAKEVPKEELMQEAERIIQERRDIQKILQDVEKRISDTFFKEIWNWDAELLWEQLQNLNSETELEFILRTFLQGKTSTERKKIRGSKLKNLIIKAIDLYRKRMLVLKDQIYKDLQLVWLKQAFEERFQEEKPVLQKKWKDKLDEAWEEYSKAYDAKYEGMKETGKLTKAGEDIYKQIQDMEQGFFDRIVTVGTSLTFFNYLHQVLFPVLFLDTIGDIGRYAKFFHTKLQTGSIRIDALPEANLAHYIPEVTMKFIDNLDSNDWEIVEKRIAQDLRRRIDEFIALFMIRKGKRIPTPPPLENFVWTPFLSEPQDLCFRDTGTGYSYNPDGSKTKIPDSDLVICFSQGVGFTCHSIKQIAWSAVRGEGDPITGIAYSQELIDRMRRQHPQIFKEAEEQYKEGLKLEKELFDEEGDDEEINLLL